ncbi:MAG TPA: type II toxin-antitoxin system RelE/ParE family toxin [Acidiferrobacter sp.]|nr:type II toxin-antitoxin system RelE/ParE family toxin [Acidiferrobacter sp.]
MVRRVELTATTVKQLRKLDKAEAERIMTFLRKRLTTLDNPRSIGRALTGAALGAYWRYRVGDYRLICDVQDSTLCVLVIRIGSGIPAMNRRQAIADAVPHRADFSALHAIGVEYRVLPASPGTMRGCG